ncbi:MAG: DUF6159 family protein [Acidimicrobiales bacterium]|nr:DUF6159 family protein [Acidimicrobiales bacterium]RUA23318.1 MAG: hypothetical protein DSY73_06365 [Actinomycetota bacterium]
MAKVSWQVLRKDRELLVITVLSFACSIVVLVGLWVPAIWLFDASGPADGGKGGMNQTLALVGLATALALTVVGVFFKGALVSGAHERLSGGDPTVRSSLRRATSRLPALLPWAVLTFAVGLILAALKERAGRLGRFMTDMVGAAWGVATFLVIPAMIVDGHGTVSGLKASGSLLRETWGENLAARVGFGLLGFLAIVPAVILFFVAGALGGAALIVGIVVILAYVAYVVVVLTALSAVFQTALYPYATTGSVPAGFEGSNLRDSFILN